MNVVVIGAGIIGAAIADELARAGVTVTLIDRGRPGRDTSGRSFAWINACQKLPRSYFELSVAAMRAWQELAAQLGGPHWYRPTGNLEWVLSERARVDLEARVARLRDWGYDAELITRGRAAEVEPALQLPPDALFAHFRTEGHLEGALAVEALVARCRAAGARLVADDPVEAIDVDHDRVRAVRLGSGEQVRGDAVVCAAGWRTPEVARLAGATVPLTIVDAPGSAAPELVAVTTPVAARPVGTVHSPDLDLRPAANGGLLIEAGDINTRIDSHTSDRDLARDAATLAQRARDMLKPPGAGLGIESFQRCIRPLPLDGHPIVGWAPDIAGLYVAVTHSGITLAAHLARLATQELRGATASELEPYRPHRPF